MNIGLDHAYAQVRAFHETFDHPRADEPTLQPAERRLSRANWIEEEVYELRDSRTIVDQADAYIDIIYFALGGLVEIGVRPQALMDIVHGANMAKVQPDGTVKRREDGKIVKPDGWVASEPLLAAEVERQGNPFGNVPNFSTGSACV